VRIAQTAAAPEPSWLATLATLPFQQANKAGLLEMRIGRQSFDEVPPEVSPKMEGMEGKRRSSTVHPLFEGAA
jgi:hypothetical protein